MQTPTLRVDSACGNGDASIGGGDARPVKVAELPDDILSQVNQIGGVEVLQELRHTFVRLPTLAGQKSPTLTHEDRALFSRSSPNTPRLLQLSQVLSSFREELEVSEVGEQLCRFRKKIALSRFYDFHVKAQECPHYFLSQKPDMMRNKHGRSSRYVVCKRALGLRHWCKVTMFPGTVLINEGPTTADKKEQRTQKESHRKAAVRKVQNWRRNGKPWAAMIDRFENRGSAALAQRSVR